MEVVRRGGLNEEDELEAPKAAQRIDTLHKGILKKATSDRNPPRKARGNNPGSAATGPRAAPPTKAPQVAPTSVIVEVSSGPPVKAAPPPVVGRCGLGPTPTGTRRPPSLEDEEDTGEGPPPILRVTLEFPGPDDPESAALLPTMNAAPWKSNFLPDLRDALPTALERSMTDLANGPDASWMEDAHAGQGRTRPIGSPQDDEENRRASLMATFDADPALVAYRMPGFLSVYVRNRWLQEQLNPTSSAPSPDLLDH